MKVTEVSISLYDNSKIKGFADVLLDDVLLVRGIAILTYYNPELKKDKLKIQLPSKKLRSGAMQNMVHPIKKELFDHIVKEVLTSYDEAVKEDQQKHPKQEPVREAVQDSSGAVVSKAEGAK